MRENNFLDASKAVESGPEASAVGLYNRLIFPSDPRFRSWAYAFHIIAAAI
jgi:hypothetical protein